MAKNLNRAEHAIFTAEDGIRALRDHLTKYPDATNVEAAGNILTFRTGPHHGAPDAPVHRIIVMLAVSVEEE